MSEKYVLAERLPTVAEYLKLRKTIAWGDIDTEAAEAGLSNSIFSVCMMFNNDVIGFGRVIGDGGIYFYIQDLIVLPEFQGKGIGERIMNSLIEHVTTHAHTNAFVGLMAAKETSGFYKRFGFKERPLNGPGMFLVIE